MTEERGPQTLLVILGPDADGEPLEFSLAGPRRVDSAYETVSPGVVVSVAMLLRWVQDLAS